MSAAQADRWQEAARLFGFRCDNDRTLTDHEEAAADAVASMADRVLVDREFAAIGSDGDEDRAIGRHFGEAS